ncbi:site-specific integrase [Carbonactinospora thermoautotrophica]|uniref:site-specific integrase n=1 Tax=Carbonactinospora thermoautotrophica TaxID=1469144 RepID=UPI00082E2727|nr:site-specific integrase [Carbonactinospora thermoautotrophica]
MAESHAHLPVPRQLDALVERLVARDDVSTARARQLRWVARELTRALRREDFPRARTVADLLANADAYLDLAARGELRSRSSARTQSSTASMRVRVDCLQLIAQAAGLPPLAVDRPGMPEPKETVASWQRSMLWRYLTEHADRWPGNAARARVHALIGVVLDTGARAGELCAMRVDDLAPDLTTIRITRRPQARSVNPPVTETVPLSTPTIGALRRWLALRAELVKAVQGGKTALWVSIRANHAGVLDEAGATPRPPGMPLRPRGLARAYTRAIVEINQDLAGTPGWRPLPYRLEQLRRAVAETGAA